MKFYGIDVQGYLKLRSFNTSVPAYGAADSRRLVDVHNYLATGSDAIFLGSESSNDWVRVVMDDGSDYPSLQSRMSSLFHPRLGSTSLSFKASSYSGSGDDVFRITDKWVKLSDNFPAAVGFYGGLLVELDSISSELDDAKFYFHVDGSPSLTGWYCGFSGEYEMIANHDWVTQQIAISEASSWSDAELDVRFVRWQDAGDGSSNTTYIEWEGLVSETVSGRYYYRREECYGGFVRSYNWSWNNPPGSGSGIYSTHLNYPNTVVERNQHGDIYCDVLHGVSTKARYADLAEKYTCEDNLPIGTVVGVPEDDEYEVSEYTFDMNGCIGVVSENPAFLMNSESIGTPIALAGKVPVMIVGEITRGDFLIPVDGGKARRGDPKNNLDLLNKFAISLETSLLTGNHLVECIIK